MISRPEADLKYRSLEHALRTQIVQGHYQPGQRLPNRTELAGRYQVGMATVQKALDALIQDGFVHARTRHGTFVALQPPHLSHIALVYPGVAQQSRFFQALHHSAETLSCQGGVSFREYVTSDQVHQPRDEQRLIDDAAHYRFGGMIFVFSPRDVQGTAALDQEGIARVAIEAQPGFRLPSVAPDTRSFLTKAVKHLAERSRRRIAHLVIDAPHRPADDLEPALAALGVEHRSYWVQKVPEGAHFRGTANVVHLLMQLQGERRPDALIIHDDNLVEHAVAGLLAAGVRVPRELAVVAHCNFPVPVPSVLPLQYLGYDTAEMLRRCLRLIELQRQQRKAQMLIMLPALFAQEAPPAIRFVVPLSFNPPAGRSVAGPG